MHSYFIVALFIAFCHATTFEQLILEEWKEFKTRFNKSYVNDLEESFRREIFLENRHKIALHNIEFGFGRRSFHQTANRFSDMLNHEFTYLINGFNRTARISPGLEANRTRIKNIRPSTFIKPLHVQIPDHMDWREYGAVTSVKNQRMCASCYAFSAAGAIEGHTFRKTGDLVELSPQNLVDCSMPQGNNGCQGGLMDGAYEYVRDNYGINSEPAYVYESRDGNCRFDKRDIAAELTGYVQIETGDEDAIKEAVATLGPVSAAIDAGQDSFQFYSDGVYYDPNCNSEGEKLNHGVLIIGYGTEDNGQEYWLVKNSYGVEWGMGGYIKMARNVNNHCGIATSATYPIL